MRARPAAVSFALLTLSLLHAWWGIRMLLASSTLMGGSQVVSAGAFLLAAASVRERSTFGAALGIAAAATGIRLLALLPPGPFFAATALLAGGLAVASWSARRLDAGRAAPWEALALRGGLAAVGVSYLAFLGAGLALGNPLSAGSLDLLVRAAAGFAAAACVDAPPLDLTRRNGFAADPASPAR